MLKMISAVVNFCQYSRLNQVGKGVLFHYIPYVFLLREASMLFYVMAGNFISKLTAITFNASL